ncbi:histidine kinase [Paenibacillus sp. 32O-W]|uniref:cache domain-containing sensor histidine kinase n=1 Tax=Paenibacillus sp. 32O-W TaxID=1695218 RepID=UPI00072269C2|nr:sensor histidine kinase [Paenibacillus sp. 32O-W]ALS27690.1 histidine kinase [Paenibacillus sp. 32O-W]
MRRNRHRTRGFGIRFGLKRKALVIFSVLVILPTLAVGIMIQIQYSNILRKQFVDTTTRNLDSVVSQLEEQTSTVKDIADYLILSPDLNEYLRPSPPVSRERTENLKRTIDDFLTFHLFSKDYIRSISIYGYNGNVIELGEPIIANEKEWLDKAVRLRGGIVWSEGYSAHSSWNGNIRVVSLVRLLNSFHQITLPHGELVIRLDEAKIVELLEKGLYKGAGFVFVLGPDGKPVLKSNHPALDEFDVQPLAGLAGPSARYMNVELGNESYLLFRQSMKNTAWDVFALIPESVVNEETSNVRISMYMMIGVMLLLCFLAMFGFQYTIIRPILRLTNETNRVKRGDFTSHLPIESNDEISVLNRNFNEMVATIRELIDYQYKLELRERETELKLLQDQMDPHFLYNTLDMIRWTARLEKAGKTSQLIEMLSTFFRSAQNNGQYVTTLRQELEFVQSYLFLQKKRLGRRFRYALYTEYQIADSLILKSSIQPLVENFIKHGMNKSLPVNVITVKCYEVENEIRIDVQDNGKGIEADRLEKIRTSLEKKQAHGKKVGALLNIHERLSIYFGEGYGLDIVFSSADGTLVRLNIPNTKANGGAEHDET